MTVLFAHRFVKLEEVKTFLTLIRDTGRNLFYFPMSLIGLQAFDLLSEGLIALFDQREMPPYYTLALLFPLTWLFTAIGTAATCIFLRARRRGQPASVSDAYRVVFRRMTPLILTSMVVALVVMIGLIAILPGIYFLAVYLFVPCLVAERERPGTLFVYLAESKRIARSSLIPLLILALVVLVLGIGLGEAQERLGSLPAKLLVSLVLSATMNTFLCLTYFHLEEKTHRA